MLVVVENTSDEHHDNLTKSPLCGNRIVECTPGMLGVLSLKTRRSIVLLPPKSRECRQSFDFAVYNLVDLCSRVEGRVLFVDVVELVCLSCCTSPLSPRRTLRVLSLKPVQ